MPDNILNRTAQGWPYLDNQNYINGTLPAYTLDLANKLQSAQAESVPRAENAATRAEQAAALVAGLTGGVAFTPGLEATTNPTVSAASARELAIGKLVIVTGLITVNNVGAGTYRITNPLTQPRTWQWMFGFGSNIGAGAAKTFNLHGLGSGAMGLYSAAGRLGASDFVTGSQLLYAAIYERY